MVTAAGARRTSEVRIRGPLEMSMDDSSANSDRHRTSFTRSDFRLLLLLCALVVVVFGKDISVGGLHDADSAAHAMDGVLIHDWVAAGPKVWGDPMRFAEAQYGHYPTLGIGSHYPPGFAVVEAGFFAVFGISAITARLCVVFFGVLAVLGAYAFVRPMTDRLTAAIACVLLVTFPASTTWGRQIMLEVPTVAVLIWAAVAMRFYLERPSGRRLAIVLAASCVAILFKQTGIFLVGAVALTIAFCCVRGQVRAGHVLVAVIIAVGALFVVINSLDEACAKTLSGYDSYGDKWGYEAISFYLVKLPSQTGVLALVLAGVGLFFIRRLGAAMAVFLLAWFVVSYAMVTTASLKVPRFFFVGLFPVAVLGAIGAARLLTPFAKPAVRTAAAMVLAATLTGAAWGRSIEHAPDYGSVVAGLRSDLDGQAVLFSGLRDGDFVFAVRQHVPWRRSTVIRGSKLLYTCTAGPDLDLVSYVSSPMAVADRMRELAFQYVFVERVNVVGTKPDDWLRTYLNLSGDYERVATHVFETDAADSDRGDVTVDVFRLAKPIKRSVEYFDIPMPRTNHPIRVKLGDGVAMVNRRWFPADPADNDTRRDGAAILRASSGFCRA